MSHVLRSRLLLSTASVVAGGLLVAGALLPWVSLLGGLRPLSGLTGMPGRVLLVAGVAVVVLGLASLRVPGGGVRWAIGLVGFVGAVTAGRAVLGSGRIAEVLAEQPLLVGSVGPGALVALAGALVALGTLLLPAPVEVREP